MFIYIPKETCLFWRPWATKNKGCLPVALVDPSPLRTTCPFFSLVSSLLRQSQSSQHWSTLTLLAPTPGWCFKVPTQRPLTQETKEERPCLLSQAGKRLSKLCPSPWQAWGESSFYSISPPGKFPQTVNQPISKYLINSYDVQRRGKKKKASRPGHLVAGRSATATPLGLALHESKGAHQRDRSKCTEEY